MKLYKTKDRLLLGGTILFGGLSSLLVAFASILMQQVIDVAVAGDVKGFYRVLAVMLVYLAALGGISLWRLLGKILIRNVTRHLRDRIFKGVMKQKPVRFSSRIRLITWSALVNDVKLVEDNYLVPLLLCFQMVVLFLATLGILLYLSPLVTCILLLDFWCFCLRCLRLWGKNSRSGRMRIRSSFLRSQRQQRIFLTVMK